MKVTRDVIVDLLPVVESGEASADTKALVDEFLRGDPEFKAIIHRGIEAVRPLGSPQGEGDELEVKSLNAIVKAVRRRTTFLSLALLATFWPFAFTFDAAGIYFLFRKEWGAAALVWIVAGLLWVNYFRQKKRARELGV